jgi:guanine deaminase
MGRDIMGCKNFILKGDVIYSASPRELVASPGAFLVCKEGKSAGVFPRVPDEFKAFPVTDVSGCLVIPGLVDLHCHAPQYARRALGMDSELLQWLEKQAFPEEAKYRDIEYARRAYSMFIADLTKSATSRICLFATLHVDATLLLMDMLEEAGLVACVGKVNMDRNSPDILREKDAESSAEATKEWLRQVLHECGGHHYNNIVPILTPRFIPSCSDKLMRYLSEIQKEFKLPLQSHLSENKAEIALVRELSPESSCYGDAYARFNLFGGAVPTIMAHCVWSDDTEITMMRERGIYIAHCPQSNTNISSGIAPLRRELDAGIKIGLGSDVAGGSNISIFRAMTDAIHVSKLYNCYVNKDEAPLSLSEAFYLGTAGGGAFFGDITRGNDGPGKCGSFAAGFDFDALVLDDSDLSSPFELTLTERLERVIYLSADTNIKSKFVKGRRIDREH